ncbi:MULTISPECIES: PTS galactitol transporter subunit IIC [Aerococcus]|uniref:PTS galactitol transporter subunit IIC n=1 Tax=Aerococcus mictus TaxID=2976810 RepID=A0A9Q4DGI9_9LACT|nr:MULTISPECIES: PTS transporter subunit IIC [Aerococcus]AEA01911.1 PTS system Galactitol-specific IIC component [Aerococcus sp. Group 1]MCY3031494.1 PTS galactitol transporter subunit IIC [Aerococcus sp. Group 1]MCY3039797.1 PTS galactitol transporter subunit IIC [Aerococcus sp. Group 2]MCY3041605.1 PTS galactitol transporter subunit IIC [Aerococcus sp. Group 2]MCY3043176.1 PTS galactitol transporter subunit IIC [Aerococcus sp. Group 2]
MDIILNAFEWFISLGSNVFLPIIIFIIGLLFGLKPGKAFISGITVGIGSIGLGLVLDLLSNSLGAAIQDMGQQYGASLNILDIGVGVGGPLAFSTSLGILMIPISLIINFIFIYLGWTKVLNVDIWNFWFPIFMGLVGQAITGKFAYGLLIAIIAVILQWTFATFTQRTVSEFFGYPGIAISHMMATSGAIFAIMINWIFERIPGFNKIDMDAETLTERFGIFGDTVVIGLIIGIVVGIFAGYDVAGIGTLGMSTAAIMKIMPKMVAMFMEGLMPIAEAAQEFANRRLEGREVLIGMDAALTVGHSTVMSTSLLLVPISLVLALILPGNKVLPFGDLAFFAFAICLMIPFFKGNVMRSIIGSSIYVIFCLYMSTWLAPIITDVFNLASFDIGTSGLATMLLAALWPVGLLVIAYNYLGIIGIGIYAVIVITCAIYFSKIKDIETFS